MTKIKVNINYKGIQKYDSKNREEHLIERMASRGISIDNIKEAVQKGPKKIRTDQSIIAEFKWFKVIYREYRLDDLRKIYPITVVD